VNEICLAVSKGIENSTNCVENLGHGVGTSVKQMIQLFQKVNNCHFETIVCPRRAGDLEVSVLDNPSSFMEHLYTIENLLKL
jgi:UDP-glucose 4-epimerase